MADPAEPVLALLHASTDRRVPKQRLRGTAWLEAMKQSPVEA